jgi:hypothetical protein
MSLSANAIITLADAKTSLGRQAISEADDLLETVIEAVSVIFQNEAYPDLKSATHTAEVYDGNGRSYFYLDHYPVTTFNSLAEDGTTLIKDTDYFVDMDDGIVEKGYTGWPGIMYAGKWTANRGGIVVTYVAGYSTLPADIKLAALIEVGRQFSMIREKMFGESTRTQEGMTISVNTDELLPSTLATLGRYVRVQI